MLPPFEDNVEQSVGPGERPADIACDTDLQRLTRELEETRATLGAANRRLQAVLDAASEISIIATGLDGLITMFNHGSEKMLGYLANEVVGKQTPLAFHLGSEIEGRGRLVSGELERPVRGFQVFVEKARDCGMDRQDWTYVRKDGTMLLVNLTVTPIHDEGGAISGFLGIAEDISRQKAMEHQIVEHEKLLATIIDSIPNPIFYKDTGGVYTGCNDAFCAFLGLPRERIVGATAFGVAPAELAGIYHRADLDLLERAESLTYEARVVSSQGVCHDVIFYKSCIRNREGAIRGLVGVMLDITDRKQVELELSRSEELFHLLFEKSGDANLLIDDGIFIDCNLATLRMLGLQHKEQVISSPPEQLSPQYQPDGRLSSEKSAEMIRIAYRQGSHRFEWLHKRGDGSELPVEVMLTVIPMHERRILHTAWRDLSAHKRAEAENEKLTQNLLHAQKIESIGRLAGGVAHDFNNLLTPIMVYADMLQKFCAADPKAAQMLGAILGAAGKARDLTRQLLAFGRKQQLEMKAIDLNRTIKAFSLILERAIREDVHIEMKLDPGLWTILADSSQIEQVVMNLAINAQDSMPAGGTLVIETANCRLEHDSLLGTDLPPGPYVKLLVSDNGCGIDAETLGRIFEPFFTTKEQGKGTGLGLATVFGIVKQHGGSVGVMSELGQGSSFTLHFPSLTEPGRKVAAELPADDEPCPPGPDAVILLVEDDEMLREMACELLVSRGHRVLVAETPAMAREIMELHGGDIDLLLSDVVMPEINGLALYEELKGMRPGLKVLFMSGYSDNIITRQNLEAESFNYIQKPFSTQALFAEIGRILGG